MSRNQTIGTVVARLIVFSGYQWYTAHERQVELSEGLTDLVYSELRSIQSAIFDANWQVREPAAPASAALLRQGAQDLIMGRERLHVLSYPIFHPVVNTQQLGDLADRVHVIALKLQDAADQGDAGRAAGYSKALRELNEGLADRYFTIEQFSSELAQVLAPRWPNVNAIPDAPPGMQLIVGGSYAPVRRGGYC